MHAAFAIQTSQASTRWPVLKIQGTKQACCLISQLAFAPDSCQARLEAPRGEVSFSKFILAWGFLHKKIVQVGQLRLLLGSKSASIAAQSAAHFLSQDHV